jgi:hypothetical protein
MHRYNSFVTARGPNCWAAGDSARPIGSDHKPYLLIKDVASRCSASRNTLLLLLLLLSLVLLLLLLSAYSSRLCSISWLMICSAPCRLGQLCMLTAISSRSASCSVDSLNSSSRSGDTCRANSS